MTKNLVIMGPPGAGKGTHAKEIATHFQIPWISTGDIFRKHKAEKTELGKLIESYIDKGEFVPDSVTDRIVCERISQTDATAGFLLDGYPRSIPQAKVLKAVLAETNERVDAVIYLDVSAAEVKRRLLKRAEIEGRTDDTPEVIDHRLEVFFEATQPLLDFYEQEGVLRKVDGEGTISEIAQRLLAVMEEIERI
ncbi:adenylate kinase [Mobiluncus sp.]|uniref:adenylate kinase n=1 Tax=Mobiluncus sp. TaxID=47293 RepID=UPI002A91AD7E|nr:adenylate kinase [Mobiluncus sp.]MDY6076815.1 adenylate kinase [Mobiluncus sp.]